MKFQVSFNFEQFEDIQEQLVRRHRRRSSLPPRVQSLGEQPQFGHRRYTTNVSSSEPEGFSLTEVTLDYLKSRSDLMATITSLVSKEDTDDLEYDLNSDFFKNTPEASDLLLRSLSQEQIDIRKFRLNMLNNNFPELLQHMTLQVLAMERCRNVDLSMDENQLDALLMSSLTESFRTCLLSSPSHGQYYKMLTEVTRHLLSQKKWAEVLRLLESIPATTYEYHTDLDRLRDFILCCLGLSEDGDQAPGHGSQSTNWDYLLQIRDPLTRIRAVLGSLKSWPVDVCVDLLQNSSNLDISDSHLKKALEIKLSEMLVYQRVR